MLWKWVLDLLGTSMAVYNNSIVKLESKEEGESGGKALEKLWDLENCRCSPTCLLFTNFADEAILFPQITTH